MQIPSDWAAWRAVILTAWSKHRTACTAAIAMIAAAAAWLVPAGHEWILSQAQAYGLVSTPVTPLPSALPSPTVDPIVQLQKSVDTLSADDQSEQAARQQDQAALQQTVSQIQQVLADVDQSEAELDQLIGIAPSASPAASASAKTSAKSAATAKAAASATALPKATVAAPASSDGLVHLNSATLDELETLPGIGATYAQRIIAYRLQHGSFSSLEELENVKGIGPATLAKLKPHLAL